MDGFLSVIFTTKLVEFTAPLREVGFFNSVTRTVLQYHSNERILHHFNLSNSGFCNTVVRNSFCFNNYQIFNWISDLQYNPTDWIWFFFSINSNDWSYITTQRSRFIVLWDGRDLIAAWAIPDEPPIVTEDLPAPTLFTRVDAQYR